MDEGGGPKCSYTREARIKGKQKASFNLKLNKNNKRKLDQRLDKGTKAKYQPRLAKQSANQKYKVQIKRQNAKLKIQKHIPLGTGERQEQRGNRQEQGQTGADKYNDRTRSAGKTQTKYTHNNNKTRTR